MNGLMAVLFVAASILGQPLNEGAVKVENIGPSDGSERWNNNATEVEGPEEPRRPVVQPEEESSQPDTAEAAKEDQTEKPEEKKEAERPRASRRQNDSGKPVAAFWFILPKEGE